MNIGPLSGTSTTVNLPTNGATIYVQLETHLGGTILENNNTYTEFTQAAASITSPVKRQHIERRIDYLHLDGGQRWSDRILSPHRHNALALPIW